MQQQSDSSYRPPWRHLLLALTFAVAAELAAFRWGQEAKALLTGLIGFVFAIYAVYVGIFRVTGLWRRVIVFAFSAGMLCCLSALVVDTLQLKAIAISFGVGLLLVAAELKSKLYPDSVIDDILSGPSR